MKNLVFLSFFCFFFDSLASQQLPIFNQAREYGGLINPAFVSVDYFVSGIGEKFIKVGGGQRLQWVANENFTVSTSVLNGEGFFNLGGVSLLGGGYFMYDEVDVTKMNGFWGRFAVYVGDTRNHFWGGLGFNAGYVNHSIDLRKLKAFDAGDDLLNYANLTASTPDFGVGGFGVYQWDSYEKLILFGISVPQLLEADVSFADDVQYDYTRIKHLYGRLSFIANTSPDDFGFFEVSLWAKYVKGITPNIDLNLRYQVSSPFWFGIGGTTNATVHLEVGTNLAVGKISGYDRSQNYLKIGYGLDISFNPNYASHYGSSHEINVAYVTF